MPNEIWKPIKNYENLYEVSNLGNVRSLKRSVLNSSGKYQNYPSKLLKQEIIQREHTNYRRVSLSKGHVISRFQVHRLVANAFVNNPNNLPMVNHLNNNGEDNLDTNLEWCTHSENMIHAQKQGRLFKSQSKGGTIGGRVGIDKMLAKVNLLYDTTVNSWTILSNSHSSKITRGGNKYNYVRCECACGFTQDIEVGRIIRKEVTMCSTCAQAKRNKLKI